MRLKVVILGLLFGLGSACGKPPTKPFSSVLKGDSNGSKNLEPDAIIDPATGLPVDNPVPMAASLAAFESKVYTPILGPYCAAGCHTHEDTFAPKQKLGAEGEAPTAPPGIEKAHLEFLKLASINAFAGVDQNRMVLKMNQNGGHNCWEGQVSKCKEAMQEGIKAWLGELEAVGFKPTPAVYPNSTESVALMAMTPVVVPIDPNDYLVGKVEQATLAAPFVMATDDVDGPIKSYVHAPAGTAAGGNAANQAQSITFNVTVTNPAPYFAWARVKTPAATKSRFFFNANATAPVQFLPGVTTDAWKWVRINTVAQNAATDVPVPFTLAAGTAPVRIFYRDPEARVNMVVMTTRRDDFNGELFSNQYYDIKVPLKVAGVEGASIIATVWEQSIAEGKKSLGVKELKIDSPVPLRVKNIKPLINGLFYANHATYTIVDTVAGGPNPVISTGGASSSVWITDKGLDSLSFSFEVLEVAP